ncbi:hypothetical protein TNCV_2533281 [Trichonephila clavipes]|nr:hypothetical protein TNCV_2533281 [Trichonephila clavipes]
MCASISISCYNKIQERQLREREYKERRSKEASVEVTLDRTHSSLPRGGGRDDESSDGCYVPEVDFRNKQRTNDQRIRPLIVRDPFSEARDFRSRLPPESDGSVSTQTINNRLHEVDGRLEADHYVVVLLQGASNTVFQQDNGKPHVILGTPSRLDLTYFPDRQTLLI